jgi:addiction module HigA family antidote
MADTDIQHPGHFIKSSVIPPGMSVKKAAELIGVGRPALSNLLNGNASLSPDMALRLEKAFGVKRKDLLRRQAAFDDLQNRHREKEVAVRAYAPAFLGIEARLNEFRVQLCQKNCFRKSFPFVKTENSPKRAFPCSKFCNR